MDHRELIPCVRMLGPFEQCARQNASRFGPMRHSAIESPSTCVGHAESNLRIARMIIGARSGQGVYQVEGCASRLVLILCRPLSDEMVGESDVGNIARIATIHMAFRAISIFCPSVLFVAIVHLVAIEAGRPLAKFYIFFMRIVTLGAR